MSIFRASKSAFSFAVPFGLLLCSVGNANAADFPVRPITVVVPYSAGGAIDLSTRIVARKAGEILKQSIIVDNRPGANGTIGGSVVARATADGYTLFAGSPGTMTAPAAFGMSLSYDIIKDFTPVTLVSMSPNIVVSAPSKPANSVRELLDMAAESPGKLTFASAGIGTTTHMAGEMLQSLGRVKMLHVPYKGTSVAVNDVIAGRVDFMVADASVLSFVKSGRLKALAVATKEPSSLVPGVPTVASNGLPGYGIMNWHGWFAPNGTPDATVNRLHAALVEAVKDPEVVRQLANAGMEAIASETPEALGAHQREDIEQWHAIVESAGIELE